MKDIAHQGGMLALAVIVGYVELLIPMPIFGMKLGLANVIVIAMMYIYGNKAALAVSVLRVVIIALLFGNMFSFMFAISGAMVSFVVMSLFKKLARSSIVFISIMGSLSHIVAQIVVCFFVMKKVQILYYLPILMLVSIVTGYLVGFLSNRMIRLCCEYEDKRNVKQD